MDPLVEEYCCVCSLDLPEQLGIDNHHLPVPLEVTTLLNPSFGTRIKVEESRLMTEEQYILACRTLLGKMQDILDENAHDVSSSNID